MVMFMVMFTIFTQAGVPARSGWSQMNTIDHIAVSIAASASATVAATVVRAIMVDAQSWLVAINQKILAQAESNVNYQAMCDRNTT